MAEVYTIICGHVNCYIVVENENAILIDTGLKKYRETILKKCRELNVKLIVLTHGHIDHCQNTAYLAKILNIPIAMSEKDLNLIPDNKMQPLFAKSLLGKIVLLASLSSMENDHLEVFEPSVFLNGGDTLSEYGVNAKIVELTGHTEGSIGIEVDGNKLFVGDALMNMLYPTVSLIYGNEQSTRESAHYISEAGDKTIYFGHGMPKKNRKWIK
ncbi:MAG: MBL fold metallo-hydrolase [Lachnospiraceae bacterium]|nr:MBL fold metallo-hydrolase [Lachnospiraceae bacterium]